MAAFFYPAVVEDTFFSRTPKMVIGGVYAPAGGTHYLNSAKISGVQYYSGTASKLYFCEKDGGKYPALAYKVTGLNTAVIQALQLLGTDDQGWRTLTVHRDDGSTYVYTFKVKDIAWITPLSATTCEIYYVENNFLGKRYVVTMDMDDIATVFEDTYAEDGTPYGGS